MELRNATGMEAAYTMGMEPSGRELLVVVVKGTFRIPQNSERAELADEQQPLVMADTFGGEPGFSAPVYEADFSPYKPRCDILLNGSAYAPGGRSARKVRVSMRVGAFAKAFNVIGQRRWDAGPRGISTTPPEPFETLAINYEGAFGGLDNFHRDPAKHTAYMANPVGRGYHNELARDLVDGTPLPITEQLSQPVTKPDGQYRPMAFGAIGRGWAERLQYAGTYGEDWLEDVFPFLPADFQPRYHQAAPSDQQQPFLAGGEEVFLENLTPDGSAYFVLPTVDVPVVFFKKRGPRHEASGTLDTLLVEPDLGVFTLTWRTHLALKRNIFEVPQVLVGRMNKGWRARGLGKDHHPSPEHLARSKMEEADGEGEA